MDFLQERITTIHDFRIGGRALCLELEDIAMERPMTLLMPMQFEEIFGDHIQNILTEINQSNFLKKVVIALSADDEQQYIQVKQLFSSLEIPCIIVWCNGPSVQQVIKELNEKNLDVSMFSGKGKDTWIALGVATLDSYAIAMHDADIVSYSRLLPAKLLYAIVEPDLEFFFNKGYYARIDMERLIMYGRVSRLLLSPLLISLLEKTNYGSDFLKYMCAFKYPLSDEFGITSDLALNIRIPGDWGLEAGLLAEVFMNTALKRICQVDLGFYEHKHMSIKTDSEDSIQKMVKDTTKAIFRNLVEVDGIDIDEAFLRSVNVLFKRAAQDRIRQYHADALCNGLNYSRHTEECIIEAFSEYLLSAGREFIKNPADVHLPDWKRAISAMPDIREKLKDAALNDYNNYG